MTTNGAGRTVGWGIFCACSWTWCIGMYLPAIMLRTYGWPGFVAFAIPNVVGCAAFGYVLRTAARSQRLVADHGAAAVWFSSLTIAYHLLFAVLVVTGLWPATASGSPGTIATAAVGAMAGVFFLGLGLSTARDAAWPWIAGATHALSLVAFVVLAREPGTLGALEPRYGLDRLAWLIPVITFGFLLCPYLDLTFHRALQRGGRGAFGVFAVTFTVMIVFTCFLWFRPSPLAHGLALGHLAAQSVFTVGAHLREIRLAPAASCPRRHAALLGVPWLIGGGFLAARLLAPAIDGEAMYLRMLVLWGLVFPLIVWVFIGPTRPAPPTRRTLVLFSAAVLAALPFYEAAFIHHRTWVLAVPTVAFVAWVMGRRRAPASR